MVLTKSPTREKVARLSIRDRLGCVDFSRFALCALIICIALTTGGCWADPDAFGRHPGNSIYFHDQQSVAKRHAIPLPHIEASVAIKGLFYATVTSSGRVYSLRLRLECTFPRNRPPSFHPRNARAEYKELELLLYADRVVEENIAKGYRIFDVHFTTATDRKKTISIIDRLPEFYEPNLTIDLSEFISVDGVSVPIEPIVAYPRNPLERSGN